MTVPLRSPRPVLRPDDVVHLARATLDRSRPRALHGHAEYELIWVQNGRARHHLPGRTEDLSEGAMRFVRPGHHHGLQARADETMVVSVTFAPSLIDSIGARHSGLLGQMFWGNDPAPASAHRDMRALADVNHAALRLERGAPDALTAETFLLPLCAALRDQQAHQPSGGPDWLATACAASQDPTVFRDGAAGFARAAGRAHAHVSRTARQVLGQSPSEYINDIRMAHAARKLASSPDTLAEIASDCGIPNLSHFHKLFRAHHGLTPGDFRRRFQRDIVQPD